MIDFHEDIKYTQMFLGFCGSYGSYKAKVDGIWGPKTNDAMTDFEMLTEVIKDGHSLVTDLRSENCICSLHPNAQLLARDFLLKCEDFPNFKVKIISGLRSYREQDRLYAKGRTEPGRIVTNSKAGQSYHQFGVAFDCAIFSKNGTYLSDDEYYREIAEKIKDVMQIDCGIDWKTFKDPSHYQLINLPTITKIRKLFESGKELII